MNNSKTLYFLYATLGIAMLILLMGFTLSPYPVASVVVAPLGIAWIFALRQAKRWIMNTVLFMMILTTILAAWLGINRYLLLIEIIFALAAWDILNFHTRLKRTENVLNRSDLINTHLIRLAIVSALGFFLALISFLLKLEVSFGWALILGLLLIISLSRTIGLARRNQP